MHDRRQRKSPRRREDRVEGYTEAHVVARAHALQPFWRRMALVATVCWAIIASTGFIALFVQKGQSDQALDHANAAVRQSVVATIHAFVALRHANTALDGIESVQRRQHKQLEQGCVRLNIQRATLNVGYSATFALYHLVLTQTRADQGSLPRRERVRVRRFTRALYQTMIALRWTPLTDCAQAVDINGANYKPPAPVLFLTEKPPVSALSATNAARLVPVDSVP